MLFKKKYDLIFSLGEACSCTQILRKCRLQFFSYPYDWLFGSDILTRIKILTNNYKDFINLEDLEDTGYDNKDKNNLCEIYRNTANNIIFNHDFKYGKLLSETYQNVKNKYERRAQRLISQIESSKNVLVVYLQTPNNEVAVDDNTLIESYKILQNRFPNQSISLIYLYCDHQSKYDRKKIFCIKENLYKAVFDYDAYNKELPYTVDSKILHRLFCQLKISNKFMNFKNFYKRSLYMIKCLFRGML